MNQIRLNKATPNSRIRRITLVELLLYVILTVIAIGSGHFVAQLFCFFLIVLFIATLIRSPSPIMSNVLFPCGFVILLILLCIPFDLAMRDSTQWNVQITDVQYGPDRIERDAMLEEPRIIAYRGVAAFVDVRWALLITVPSNRIIYTPLFVHPLAPFLIGEKKTEAEMMEDN